jgi:hypothetical protein
VGAADDAGAACGGAGSEPDVRSIVTIDSGGSGRRLATVFIYDASNEKIQAMDRQTPRMRGKIEGFSPQRNQRAGRQQNRQHKPAAASS